MYEFFASTQPLFLDCMLQEERDKITEVDSCKNFNWLIAIYEYENFIPVKKFMNISENLQSSLNEEGSCTKKDFFTILSD